jgi:DNA polymerase-3 subunit epsilon
MSTPKWHEDRMVAVDFETSGTSVHADRIVTAAIVHHTPGQRPRTLTWLIDPGIPVPDEAAAVHGWTSDRLTAELAGAEAHRITTGRTIPITRGQALYEITGQLALAMSQQVPVVAANASFDLSMLEAENTRHDQPTLADRLAPGGVRGVVDVMVIEKQYDVYRKVCYKAPGCDRDADPPIHECGGCRGGKTKCGGCGATDRKLTSLCAHYGVLLGAAHSADADALAALRLAGRLAAAWPEIARWRLPTLHEHQVEWRREQMDGLRDFHARVGKLNGDYCGSWPMHGDCCAPAPVEQGALL